MNRRDSLKALGALAASAGITMTPITAQDAGDAVMLVLKVDKYMSTDAYVRLRDTLANACRNTPLEGVQVIVLEPGMSLELIKVPK